MSFAGVESSGLTCLRAPANLTLNAGATGRFPHPWGYGRNQTSDPQLLLATVPLYLPLKETGRFFSEMRETLKC